MAIKSKIQWTDATWNIARGCTKVDEDCKYCYMYRGSLGGHRYNPATVVKTKTVFNLPLKIKKPSKIFTCSLTDFFHIGCDSFRPDAWDIIKACPRHTFQILTKRPERIKECMPSFWEEVNGHVWLGTSVGSVKGLYRAKELVKLRNISNTLFLSIEPLYERLVLPSEILDKVDWVIIGGESGNDNGKYKYRPCKVEWIKVLVNQCKVAGVKVFVKQLGTTLSKELQMSDRHGQNINEFPKLLRVREFPL